MYKLSIIDDNFHYAVCEVTNDEKKQIEEWTGLALTETLFDSAEDNWNNPNDLNGMIIKEKRLLFLIEDDKGERFGYYTNVSIKNVLYKKQAANKNSFLFTLNSTGRLKEPMKFEVTNIKKGGIQLFGSFSDYLIRLGDCQIGAKDNGSYWKQNDDNFNYHGIENALCEREKDKEGKMKFNVKRIIVFQMQ